MACDENDDDHYQVLCVSFEVPFFWAFFCPSSFDTDWLMSCIEDSVEFISDCFFLIKLRTLQLKNINSVIGTKTVKMFKTKFS